MGFFKSLRRVGRKILPSNPVSKLLKLKPSSKKVKEISTDQQIKARIADQAYKDNRASTISSPDGPYEYQSQYSNRYTATYINHNTRDIIIGNRGTKLTSTRDLVDDARIIQTDITGDDSISKSSRVKELNNLIGRLKQSYPGYKINTTGHSLGGRVSKEVARKNPDISHTGFNTGGFDPLGNLRDRKRDNIQEITTGNDPISIGTRLFNPNTIVYNPKKKVFSHGIDSFL